LGIAVCAIVAMAADKPLPNQAENRKLKIEATAITDPKLVAQEVGTMLGDGYIVVKLHLTPLGPDPLPLSPDDFTLVSRKNGEKGGALPPDGFINPKITAALEAKVFKASEGKEPTEGLLYFMMEGKLKPSQLGLIYVGQAGRLIVDFK
jgi:hypothetical protein